MINWLVNKIIVLTCIGVGYGGGKLGGGKAAGAGDGAGPLLVDGTGTGLALPPSPNGPLLRGSPVVGKSDFLGAAGLGVVVACVGVEANTTDPPSEPYNRQRKKNSNKLIDCTCLN
jgi:hypothetical protein